MEGNDEVLISPRATRVDSPAYEDARLGPWGKFGLRIRDWGWEEIDQTPKGKFLAF
jgi:hypothetical protein